jgi:hypothetical protein
VLLHHPTGQIFKRKRYIDAEGKPFGAEAPHCGKPVLDKPATLSLLNAQYKPGSVNDKAVPVKVSIHLELGQFPSVN